MPAAYFRQIPDAMRQQHIIAISAMKQLQQSDLSLRIKTETEGKIEITVMNSEPCRGSLLAQLKTIPVPKEHELSRVKVFSSGDNQLALNIYTFKKTSENETRATRADADHIYSLVEEMKTQEVVGGTALFSKDMMDDYISKCSPDYVSECDGVDFLTQRKLYEKVRNSDRTEVFIESNQTQNNTTKITIASSNVRPEVLLRLTTTILTARKIEINRVHLDTVLDPEGDTNDSKGSVTMLRLLINQDEVTSTNN